MVGLVLIVAIPLTLAVTGAKGFVRHVAVHGAGDDLRTSLDDRLAPLRAHLLRHPRPDHPELGFVTETDRAPSMDLLFPSPELRTAQFALAGLVVLPGPEQQRVIGLYATSEKAEVFRAELGFASARSFGEGIWLFERP